MIRSSKLFRGGVAVFAIGLLSATGTARAEDNFFDTGDVVVDAETRAVKVGVGAFSVSADKVSDPTVRVWVRDTLSEVDVTTSTYAAGENGCAAKDDPLAGTLNRSIHVGLDRTSVTVYVKVQYTTTTPLGMSTTTTLEPLGPNGTTFSPLVHVAGELPPITICVS